MQIITAFRQTQLPMTKGTLTGPTIHSAFNMMLRHLVKEGRKNPLGAKGKLDIGIYALGEDGHNYSTLLYLLNEFVCDHVLQLISRIRMPTVRAQLTLWAEDLLNLRPGMAHQIAHWRGGRNYPLTITLRDPQPRAGLRNTIRNLMFMQYLHHSLSTDHIGFGTV